MNDFQAEYEMGLEMLGFPGMVYFKFLSMFRVKDGSVSFGLHTDTQVDSAVAETFRSYLKQQKEWVKAGSRSRQEVRQRLWWTVQKVLDAKVFSEHGQRYLMFWHDSCDDQLL
jgi:hypothetical protein